MTGTINRHYHSDNSRKTMNSMKTHNNYSPRYCNSLQCHIDLNVFNKAYEHHESFETVCLCIMGSSPRRLSGSTGFCVSS